jgi:hypothetical protein
MVRSCTCGEAAVNPKGHPMFQLVKVIPGGEPEILLRKDGKPRFLKTGKAAAKAARLAAASLGFKVQPRRVADCDWKAREQARFGDGTYKLLPWQGEAWWFGAIAAHPLHYAHVSAKYPGRVAFTADEAKGLADIQTPMKAGKYLTMLRCGLNSAQIADWSAKFSAQFEDGLLQLATTREDCREVYETGPASCMSGKAEIYASKPYHPAEVYAHPTDCAVAYLARGGRTTARVVVSRELKQYTRIYGDQGRLEPLLKTAGYKHGSMLGAKLLKIPHKGGVVMPYLDCGYYAHDHKDGKSLEIVGTSRDAAYCTCNTNGMAGPWNGTDENEEEEENEGWSCACCDEHNPGEAIGVYGDDAYWCESCFGAYGFTCNHCHDNHHIDDLRTVHLASGSEAYWCARCARRGAAYDSITGRYTALERTPR